MSDLRPLHERHPVLQQTYDDLVSSSDTPSERIVTISGRRATGASTHAEHLAIQFDLTYMGHGALQRDAAREAGYTDVDRFREENPDVDVQTDRRKLELFWETDGLIAEDRLGAPTAIAARDPPEDTQPIAPVRIKVTCDVAERARRYAARKGYDDIDVAKEEMLSRDNTVYTSFADLYEGLDPTQDQFYTHTVDNTGDYDAVHRELEDILTNYGFTKKDTLTRDEKQQIAALTP